MSDFERVEERSDFDPTAEWYDFDSREERGRRENEWWSGCDCRQLCEPLLVPRNRAKDITTELPKHVCEDVREICCDLWFESATAYRLHEEVAIEVPNQDELMQFVQPLARLGDGRFVIRRASSKHLPKLPHYSRYRDRNGIEGKNEWSGLSPRMSVCATNTKVEIIITSLVEDDPQSSALGETWEELPAWRKLVERLRERIEELEPNMRGLRESDRNSFVQFEARGVLSWAGWMPQDGAPELLAARALPHMYPDYVAESTACPTRVLRVTSVALGDGTMVSTPVQKSPDRHLKIPHP